MLTTSYTLSATSPLPFADAVERVRAELKTEGFGVLCEIDVQATLRKKLGVDGEPYLIPGACNPPLAHQALEAEPDLGVLLPCNVVIYQRSGETQIAAIDRKGCSRSSTTTTSPPWPQTSRHGSPLSSSVPLAELSAAQTRTDAFSATRKTATASSRSAKR
jgi:uncharacterized protein (DUF302 family)